MSRVVPRPRLLESLRAEADLAVILLVAGAGYGKTTLLQQWATSDDRPFVELRLNRTHDDPKVLLAEILDALGEVEPVPAATRRALLLVEADVELAVVPRLRRFLATRRTAFVLALDDAHELRRTEAWTVVAAIAESLPEGSQLVIASRRTPPLPVERLRADRRLWSITPESLLLTREETGDALATMGLTLDPELVDHLFDRTEGWPVAVYLAGVAARGEVDADHLHIERAGDDRMLMRYLRDEVLGRLSKTRREFLVRTAIVDDLRGGICDAILDRQGSATLLEFMARDQQLVQQGDAGSYRAHPLIRAALLEEFGRLTPEEQAELHRRAGVWLASQGDLIGAVAHALETGDDALVDAWIWSAAGPLMAAGFTSTVATWLEELSPDRLRHRPALATTAAWHALLTGDVHEVRVWSEVVDRVPETELLPDGVSVVAAAALLRALVASAGIRTMVDDATRAADLYPPDDAYRPIALYIAGAGQRLLGDRAAALALVEEGAALGALVTPPARVQCLGQLALLALDIGDVEGASRHATTLVTAFDDSGYEERPAMGLPVAAAALVAARSEDATRARRLAKRSLYLLTNLGTLAPWMGIEGRLVLARAYQLIGDAASARGLLGEAEHLLELVPDGATLRTDLDALEAALREEPLPDTLRASPLTSAELRVLAYLPTHLGFGPIGEELFVSRNTVKTHAASIYRKLGVSSRTEAVAEARRLGIVDP